MISYTTKNVYFLSFLISTIIYIVIIFMNNNLNSINLETKTDFNSNYIHEQSKIENENQIEKNETQEEIENSEDIEWKIEIPSIGLSAAICEGTTDDVMNKFVGHFEDTGKTNGNIGLAAHNRGYEVNYFENLKKLRKNDEIIYKYGDIEKRYFVETTTVIKDTDWSYLENTQKNKITLITCIENQSEYRRCIQGVEKEE